MEQGGRLLRERGRTRFGFIGAPGFCYSFQQRWRAFQAALEECGLICDPALCILENLVVLCMPEHAGRIFLRQFTGN